MVVVVVSSVMMASVVTTGYSVKFPGSLACLRARCLAGMSWSGLAERAEPSRRSGSLCR